MRESPVSIAHPDVWQAVRGRTLGNPLGNCLTRGLYAARANYTILQVPRTGPCQCVEEYQDLVSARKNAKPGQRVYFSPRQVKLFMVEIRPNSKYLLWNLEALATAERGQCTGRCTPPCEYDLIIEEVKRIVADPDYVSPMLGPRGG